MTGNVGETNDHLAVGEGLPVEIITSGIVRRPIPPGNVESCKVRRIPRKKRLLDGLRHLKVVLDRLQLALGFRLAKRCLNMLTNLSSHRARPRSHPPKSVIAFRLTLDWVIWAGTPGTGGRQPNTKRRTDR